MEVKSEGRLHLSVSPFPFSSSYAVNVKSTSPIQGRTINGFMNCLRCLDLFFNPFVGLPVSSDILLELNFNLAFRMSGVEIMIGVKHRKCDHLLEYVHQQQK